MDGEGDRTEIAQHPAYRGSSHRQIGATSHVSAMIWLYLSPIGQDRDLLFTHGDYYLHDNAAVRGGKGEKAR
jgi:hypothetical protein